MIEARPRLLSVREAQPEDTWQQVAIAYYDGAVDVWVDGILFLGANDPEPIESGSIALEIPPNGTPTSVSFDNMVVCSLSAPYAPPPPPDESQG